ncbi:aminotransferase class I/II-fold pyridoxal phosphate-dependent enzyme [Streptomyces palmae]|uniref:Aminotransferase class I/II-fold pyridoxal phosphate-dependent enzyme n=1 Tax=Streptomyces palmae TaxID=1701085 RepID=A0A4Z0H7B5_9ACTN|nr:aminotransferase class I/II-fold pyridoxal phosphate-dependent enzyme [Streptomyces palmae]TGB09571.1 aminotransferase class I/II-fold pyridoxal phosphate-dependent enzyme [Streptomyces palmae]
MDRRQPIPAPVPVDPHDALPVLPELAARFAEAAGRTAAEPPGGAPELHEAACGYWSRRGLPADPGQVLAAPGAQPLLLALLAAIGGDVLLCRPCAAWYAPLARLVGRPAYHVPVPVECGGVPDSFALLETVRRVRTEGGAPRVLVLSVADDPTGTVPPPELLHEVCEAAGQEGMLIISDESWRDTVHRPQHADVLLSPAEMLPGQVVVLADLAGGLTPPGWPAAIARFPATAAGAALRGRALAMLAAVRGELSAPVAAAAALALTEPAAVRARTAASARACGAVGAATHLALTTVGVLGLPPQAGRRLYADLSELREPLSARGITDSVELADLLTRRLGMSVAGGHLFGDAPHALRVRLPLLPLLGTGPQQLQEALDAPEPGELTRVAQAVERLTETFAELAGPLAS